MIYEILFMILLHFGCASNTSDDTEIINTLKLLKEGDEKIILNEEYKNVTLVIGNTGAGKTTFIQWIAGDDSKLISKAVGKNSREYLIFDMDDRIGNSTINSKTIFPELVVDKKTNQAYYDCPGFSDTRSVSHDIAGTYFIKKLTDFAEGFKILLAVNYHSVREGLDRKNFLELMRHTTDFLKNIEKFHSSIGIVVTKVENHGYFDEELNQYFLDSDEEITERVALFLQNVKNSLKDRLTKPDDYSQDKEYYRNTIKLLDIVLLKDNGKYARLGIFRRPNKKGPISTIPLMQEGKKHIEQMLRKRLQFAVRGANDFGYTVSDKSKNEINNLVEVIHYKVRVDITDVISEIKQYCNNLVNQVNGEVDSFIDISKPGASELHIHLAKVHVLTSTLPVLLKEVQHLDNVQDLADKIRNTVNSLGINTPTTMDKIKNIATQGRYHKFLQTVYGRKLEVGQWVTYFYPIKNCLDDAEKIKKDISDKAETVNHKIKNQNIKHLDEEELEEYYRKKLGTLEIENVPNAASDFIIGIRNLMSYRKYLELLKVLKSGKSDTWPPKWIAHLTETVKNSSESEKWYTFLGSLYADLSTYKTQINKHRYNVANIDDWGYENAPQGIQMNSNNFQKLLEKIGEKYEYAKDLELTEARLDELNHVLALTLKHKTDTKCLKPGKLVIKGSYIKTSDITYNDGKIKNVCNTSLTSVDIFALDMLIIDRDFNGVGSKLQLSIVAPKWHVVGSRKVNLDGFQPPHIPRAQDGNFPGFRGRDGAQGLPGGPAGHFFGIANEIINGESLTITANGGHGGFGQDGGNGAKGRNGEDAERSDDFQRVLLDNDRYIFIIYNTNKEMYRYYGKSGGTGGNGGNGGVGGYGGYEGTIKMLNFVQSLHSPNIKNSRGPNGRGGKGGSGGGGGASGMDLIAYRCYKYIFFVPVSESWCEGYTTGWRTIAHRGLNGKDDTNGLKLPPEKPMPFQNVPDILNNFKLYLLENLKDRFERHSLIEFINQLDTNAEVNNLYGALGLANEYLMLERQINLQKLNQENIVYIYQSILNRVNQQAKNPSEENQKVLSLLYTATLSKIYNLKADSNTNLIVDIEQNLDLLSEEIDNLRNLQEKTKKAKLIDQYKNKYKSAINKKITEAESFIKSQIIPQIDVTGANISNRINLLIDEIILSQEKAKGLKWALMQEKDELGKKLTMSRIFDSLKILVVVISFFAQFGAETIGVVGASQVVSDGQAMPQKLSDEIMFDTQTLENIFHSNVTQSWVKKINGTLRNSFDTYKANEQEIKAIAEAIEKANQDIQKFEQYEVELRETVMPVVENMKQDMALIASQLDTKSQITLEVSKWQVQRALRDMKLQIRRFTKGFAEEEHLARCIESLEEVMTTLINIYDMMQNYRQQKELADYLADISSPRSSDTDFTDTKLWEVAKELEISVRSNLVVKQYQIAIDALKQMTFPLVHLYLEEPMLPSYLKMEDDFQNLVDKAVKETKTVKRKIKEYKSSITKHDNYMNSGWFDSNYKSVKPFFVWKNEKYKDTILNLLSGKKVTVKADILTSHLDKDAVKFNMIGVYFGSSNSSISSQISEKLRWYMLKMTHLGNSYYRFKNKIFVMTSASHNIQYTFEKDNLGIPVRRNTLYDKIKSGDLMLSPYAMWEIQLINLGKEPFSELEMYKDDVDLELIGHGSYLTKGWNISYADIEKYYKIDDDLSTISYENQFNDLK